jgi:TonB family protein
MRRITGMAAALVLVVASGLSAQQQVYSARDGVTLPVVVKSVKPGYTTAAKEARIQGTVVLDSVVLADGSVGDITVGSSLDASPGGLDDQAIRAMKQWEFKPGRKDDKPVAVAVHVEMTFTLK